MFKPRGKCLVYSLTNFPSLSISPFFFTTFCMRLGLPHPSIANIPRCVCTHPIDPMGIHFLHCVHGNERTKTHDIICDTFVAIMQDVNFHMKQEQLHALPSTTFNSFRWWINIVLTKDGISSLTNVVITNPIQAYLLSWYCATQGFATSNVAQTKEISSRNRHTTNQFISLAIEVFGCLHKHANVFLHNCANVIWNLKGAKGLIFLP